MPFRSFRHMLFGDRAVAVQVPYDRPDAPIPSYTISTAHEAGWTWDIGLNNRRGVGYVYSSNHSSDERAEEILRGYVGHDDYEIRRIRFEAGYRERHWVRNCLCVGLSGGFLEPLESTGIVLIESAISKFVEFFPHDGPVDVSAAMFNDLITKRYETIAGFVKLHYCLSRASRTVLVRQYGSCDNSGKIAGFAGALGAQVSQPFRFHHRRRKLRPLQLSVYSVRHGVPYRLRGGARLISRYAKSGKVVCRDARFRRFRHARTA